MFVVKFDNNKNDNNGAEAYNKNLKKTKIII